MHASFGWPPVFRAGVLTGGLLAVRLSAIGRVVGAAHDAPRTLAVKWLRPTRLETRTKESNMCASLRVTETRRHNESESASAPR